MIYIYNKEHFFEKKRKSTYLKVRFVRECKLYSFNHDVFQEMLNLWSPGSLKFLRNRTQRIPNRASRANLSRYVSKSTFKIEPFSAQIRIRFKLSWTGKRLITKLFEQTLTFKTLEMITSITLVLRLNNCSTSFSLKIFSTFLQFLSEIARFRLARCN